MFLSSCFCWGYKYFLCFLFPRLPLPSPLHSPLHILTPYTGFTSSHIFAQPLLHQSILSCSWLSSSCLVYLESPTTEKSVSIRRENTPSHNNNNVSRVPPTIKTSSLPSSSSLLYISSSFSPQPSPTSTLPLIDHGWVNWLHVQLIVMASLSPPCFHWDLSH